MMSQARFSGEAVAVAALMERSPARSAGPSHRKGERPKARRQELVWSC
jgi:hypothetical protein